MRGSTRDQKAHLQLDALRDAGCEKIFEETASGARRDRPELNAALEFMRSGDALVVWKLDRLARSRSRKGGRPRSLSDKDLKQARALRLRLLTPMGTIGHVLACVDAISCVALSLCIERTDSIRSNENAVHRCFLRRVMHQRVACISPY
jgi:hypothetical protein